MLKYHYSIALFICYLCYWFRNDERIWITCTQRGVHTFTQEYPRIPRNTPAYPRIPLEYPKIPLECPIIPQNTNNIKILKDFGFLFIFYSVEGDISQKAD
jgi:hypothetical protein